MKRGGRGGKIVLISSTAGQRGEAYHCDYAASKGAVISMVKGLSTELAKDGITVDCVAPGWVATDMSAEVLAQPQTATRIKATIPLGRVGTPEELAAPILFSLHRARRLHHWRDLQRERRRGAGGMNHSHLVIR